MSITHAQIEPTTRCNFTCGFCAGRSMAQGDLDWHVFIRFLEEHPQLAHVELQGEGEPMLHARFLDMVDECCVRGIRVGIITNGSLLTKERIERLLASDVGSIHVSMESSEPAQFAAIRGGLFEKVRNGLEQLVARRNELGLRRPVIGLTVTVLKDTIDAIEGINRLYCQLELDGGIIMQPLQVMPAYRRHYGRAMADQILPWSLAPRFATIRAELARAAPVKRADDFFYFSLFAGFGAGAQNCPWLERGAYLTQDGRIIGCCFMKDDELGSLGDLESIEQRRKNLSESLERGVIPDPCSGCATAKLITEAGSELAG